MYYTLKLGKSLCCLLKNSRQSKSTVIDKPVVSFGCEMSEIEPKDKENETYRGIKRFAISTAAWLADPEKAFTIAHKFNVGKPKSQWLTIELYPTHYPMNLPGPAKITLEKIRQWQKEYPLTKVETVHLPFSFNLPEHIHRMILGEKKISEKVYQCIWLVIFGTAMNQYGLKLAQQMEAAVNAHPNVIVGFARNGKLEEIKKSVPEVFAENERPYWSIIFSWKPKRAREIYHPQTVTEKVIKKYGLSGLTLGVDHLVQASSFPIPEEEKKELEPQKALLEVKDVLAQVHLASFTPKGNITHGFLTSEDPLIENFLQGIAHMQFPREITAVLDYNPLLLKRLKFKEQIDLISDNIKYIQKTQNM